MNEKQAPNLLSMFTTQSNRACCTKTTGTRKHIITDCFSVAALSDSVKGPWSVLPTLPHPASSYTPPSTY